MLDIDPGALRDGLLRFIVVVLSLALHEFGHAIVADKLGDDTPRSEGRVTIYPMAHIDWIGTIIFPILAALGFFGNFAMIGWAKPVYTNPANFRRGMADEALVTLAGPGVNVLLAFMGTGVMILGYHLGSRPLLEFGELVLQVNVSLAVFNMLPIPPLDGSKFLMYWFGMSRDAYSHLAMYGSFALLLLINVPGFGRLFGILINFALVPFGLMLRTFT
jgi:Zn-dependent protease